MFPKKKHWRKHKTFLVTKTSVGSDSNKKHTQARIRHKKNYTHTNTLSKIQMSWNRYMTELLTKNLFLTTGLFMVHLLFQNLLFRLIIADRCVYIPQKTFAKSHNYIYFHYISKTVNLPNFFAWLFKVFNLRYCIQESYVTVRDSWIIKTARKFNSRLPSTLFHRICLKCKNLHRVRNIIHSDEVLIKNWWFYRIPVVWLLIMWIRTKFFCHSIFTFFKF